MDYAGFDFTHPEFGVFRDEIEDLLVKEFILPVILFEQTLHTDDVFDIFS